MRGLIVLLAIQVTVAILVNGSGAVEIDTLAAIRSGVVQDPAVAGHATNNAQRLLRKHEPVHDDTEHDTESTDEERDLSAAVKAFAEKLKSIWTVRKVDDAVNDIPKFKGVGQADHIDESINALLVGKSADDAHKDMMARLMTSIKTLDKQGFTPKTLERYIAEKKVVLRRKKPITMSPYSFRIGMQSTPSRTWHEVVCNAVEAAGT
ncbi:secreted RxLR effector peptide protein, putative [Phytophthora infestans T30-4]|uniref:RxLR effector protein n=1 Tax=Phytophthora infestans (strain T30-4) TaxID=403677 RepID=D0NHL6_PHYIT|nr:secreted RxLR effector peptide protein, putative [Phytophthora infestans T30-4]EEY58941.1 secreted RxLR effector peptide protein, putative [Phytophthora infestans T30-4]|eukprot:XP_002901414.1 secreted RxLR effector peptide protein, putative [Phytophthora infestans T30-4]